MTYPRCAATLLALALSLPAAHARAQDAGEQAGDRHARPAQDAPVRFEYDQQPPDEPGAHGDFEPLDGRPAPVMLRYQTLFLAPDGRVTFPGLASGGDVDLQALGVDDPRASPSFTLAIGQREGPIKSFADRLSGSIMAFYFETDHQSVIEDRPRQAGALALDVGDGVRTRYDFTGVDVRLGVDVIRWAPPSEDGRGHPLRFAATIGPGLRLHDTDISLRRDDGQVVRGGGTFLEPIGFVQARARIHERLDISAGGSFGSTFGVDWVDGGESFSWDLTARMAYRPTPWLSVGFGYRILNFELDNGDGDDRFENSGTFAGVGFDLTLLF